MEATKTLGLEGLLLRRPGELSGGQKQRVAMGRAIVRNPKVFLFDEPLSNLDAALRVQMRVELAKLHDKLNATMIYVTHDQVEAMTLADRVVVMKEGIIQQVGSPTEIYDNPANAFVASFIGSPAMNLIEGEIINKLHETGFSYDCILLNAGGYTHTSVAIADAISSIDSDVIEIHISNIYSREEFRQKSIISHACTSSIIGMGSNGYLYALRQISIL